MLENFRCSPTVQSLVTDLHKARQQRILPDELEIEFIDAKAGRDVTDKDKADLVRPPLVNRLEGADDDRANRNSPERADTHCQAGISASVERDNNQDAHTKGKEDCADVTQRTVPCLFT